MASSLFFLLFYLLFVDIFFPILYVDALLRLIIQQTTAEVEVMLSAIGVYSMNDRLYAVSATTLVGVITTVKHCGETVNRRTASGLEVGAEGTGVGQWLVLRHLVPPAVALQDVGWLLLIVERGVVNGDGAALELVGGVVDDGGACRLVLLHTAALTVNGSSAFAHYYIIRLVGLDLSAFHFAEGDGGHALDVFYLRRGIYLGLAVFVELKRPGEG